MKKIITKYTNPVCRQVLSYFFASSNLKVYDQHSVNRNNNQFSGSVPNNFSENKLTMQEGFYPAIKCQDLSVDIC